MGGTKDGGGARLVNTSSKTGVAGVGAASVGMLGDGSETRRRFFAGLEQPYCEDVDNMLTAFITCSGAKGYIPHKDSRRQIGGE